MKNRDDFTSKTKEILAKRVGYLCSNPNCQKHTVGPNNDQEKATSIGVAAHITAAAPGGPRFEENLESDERRNIKNGIWLCANCSILIDRDPDDYSIALLNKWKQKAEGEIRDAIAGKVTKNIKPFLEADLVWDYKSRTPNGYSRKNLEIFEQPIPAGTDLYQYWSLRWTYKFTIHNNSEVPAFNVNLKYSSSKRFIFLEELPKINNIQPFQSTEIEAKFVKFFHGTSAEADEMLTEIPEDLVGLEMEINYLDRERDEQKSEFKISEGGIKNFRY